jgi:muramoyltetrapeptide carboxypeptidase
VGGNLSLLAATLATGVSPRAEGAILFLEEVGEAAYRVDRLLTQLRLAGLLGRVAGVAVGAFTEAGDAPDAPSIAVVLEDRLGDLGVPVITGANVGHGGHVRTWPLGVRARLDAVARTVTFLEPPLV